MTATAVYHEPAPADARRRTPRRALVWATKAWLIALGLAAIAIGGHDLLVATDITVRLWGTLVLGAGTVLLAGAWGLQRDTPSGRALGMVATLLGVALGVMTFLAQVVSDEPDVRLLVWGAIIAVSAAAVYVVRGITPDEDHGGSVLSRLPILKSVVSVGVLISLGQFWYTAIYVPTTAPASLTLEPKLTQTIEGNRVVLQGTVTIHNTSGTRVNVLASQLDVTAIDTTLIPDYSEDDYEKDVAVSRRPDKWPIAERYAGVEAVDSVLHGRPVPDGAYFEPGETITYAFLAWVPKGRYSRASVNVNLTIARARALALETAAPTVTSRAGRTVSVARIPESGWLRSLTRSDRFVRVEYDDRDPKMYPAVELSPTRGRSPADFNRRMSRLYGVAIAEATTDISIPPAKG
jgi:hypothetical protein